MLFLQVLASPITVDLKMNRMECFFAMVEVPSELAGTYSVQTDGDFNFSYRISSNKDNNIFDSTKISDQFVVPAINPGVYRCCFTALNIPKKGEEERKVNARLTFDLNVLKAEKSSSDKLQQAMSQIDTQVSKIQAEYRSVRMNEQNLMSSTKAAKRRMWIMFIIEVVCISAAVAFQTTYITRLHKKI